MFMPVYTPVCAHAHTWEYGCRCRCGICALTPGPWRWADILWKSLEDGNTKNLENFKLEDRDMGSSAGSLALSEACFFI